MADMTTIKGKIRDTIYPNGKGAITAEKHQSLLLDVVDNINEVKQDTLVSGQNIRPLVSGTSLLGSGILHELGTAFIYEYESEQVFAMMNGTREEVKPWMLNRATASQVAQSISILRQGVLQTIVPVVIKTRAEYAIISWEYDGLIYEIAWEDDAYKVVTKPKGDDFDKDGNYPSLHVGTADDLAGRGESVPASFGFRASGGKSIKDGRAYIKRIKGNSVVWNQKVNYRSAYASVNGITAELLADGRVRIYGTATANVSSLHIAYCDSFIVGHKYLLTGPSGKDDKVFVHWYKPNIYAQGTSIVSPTSLKDGYGYVYIRVSSGDVVDWTGEILCHDLTQMFGAGNEPTIEEFYARVATLGVDLNAYNEGQVIHCNTESIKSVGDNAWDEEWITGRLNTDTGQPNLGNNGITSKNYIRVLPNETYYCGYNAAPIFAMFYDAEYALITGVNGSTNIVSIRNTQFTTPANAAYMRFYVVDITTYNHDICIRLAHTGYKTDYEPYWQDTLPLPIIRKYFPDGMKSAGSAHDEIRFNKASGRWEYSKGKIKSVDLGSLTWDYYSSSNTSLFKAQFADIKIASSNDVANMLCAPYTANNANTWQGDKTIVATPLSGVQIWIHDEAYKDNLEAFKAMLQEKQVVLYYEPNDWEWEELDAEDQNFRDYYNVADFGTEEAILAMDAEGNIIPSAPFSADIIYQFNAVDMIREHEIEITELQSIIATMQAQLTALTNGGQ